MLTRNLRFISAHYCVYQTLNPKSFRIIYQIIIYIISQLFSISRASHPRDYCYYCCCCDRESRRKRWRLARQCRSPCCRTGRWARRDSAISPCLCSAIAWWPPVRSSPAPRRSPRVRRRTPSAVAGRTSPRISRATR